MSTIVWFAQTNGRTQLPQGYRELLAARDRSCGETAGPTYWLSRLRPLDNTAVALSAEDKALLTGTLEDWASAVLAEQRIPLYSTSWDNVASQAIARRLGFEMFGDEYIIT